MTWHIGIDEAGYGPNLGPLVQVAVGWRRDGEPACLWELLGEVVRRADRSRDARLMVDDSKKVYATAGKLKALELGVLAALFDAESRPATLHALLGQVAPAALVELADEPWFDANERLPMAVEAEQVTDAATRFHHALAACDVAPFRVNARVTPPALFNALLDHRDNKAEVLAHGLRWLLTETLTWDAAPKSFAIDRQGGRMYHAAMLQSVCPEGWIDVIEESDAMCRYRMATPREISWSFEVEADARHFNVALASMTAKYLREVLMAQFNRFWQRHVPDLKPTAGYPTDAPRFLTAIRPAMERLKIERTVLWRRK